MCININVLVSCTISLTLVLNVKAFILYLRVICPSTHISYHKNPLETQERKQTCFCIPSISNPFKDVCT